MAFVQVDLYCPLATSHEMFSAREMYINEEKTLKVPVGMRNQILAIRAKDAAVSVVDVWVLELLALGRVELDSLGRDGLPWCQGIRAGFDGVGRCHQLLLSAQPQSKKKKDREEYITIRLGHIGKRIRILQGLLPRIQRPSGNMHLLAQRRRIGLHERVHIFPAIQVSHASNLRLHD